MKINGQLFRDMAISAANALENNKEEINNLNVFPVPDGDTGINMSLTMSGARTELADFDGTVSECADKLASVMLKGARGNSGVILSVFFRGMSKSLKGLEEADTLDMANAMTRGVEDAYKAVMTPTEGTILTVMRVCAEEGVKAAGETYQDDAVAFFTYALSVASETLDKTPELLPILKQAQVVDAGGKGFVTVLGGMLSALKGEPVVCEEPVGTSTKMAADFSDFETENIRYPYCTECIVTKSEKYFGEEKCEKFHKFAMNIGDSVVFIENDDIIKVHVHTDNPGKVLSEAIKYGMLYTVKIENMKNQHSALADGAREAKPVEPKKKYGFVTVCMGDGIKACFEDLGADYIVYGGQTMNPSTDDILAAIDAVNAETVFVLPNNKNIYMVAKQAEEMAKNKKVIVIATRSVPQGISAMMAFNEDADARENTETMFAAVGAVKSLSVTYAVRDSVIGENQIKEGSVLGLDEGKIACVADDDMECLSSLAGRVKDSEMLTVFYGEDVSDEEAAQAEQILRSGLGKYAEVVMINGGQPLYHYIISAE